MNYLKSIGKKAKSSGKFVSKNKLNSPFDFAKTYHHKALRYFPGKDMIIQLSILEDYELEQDLARKIQISMYDTELNFIDSKRIPPNCNPEQLIVYNDRVLIGLNRPENDSENENEMRFLNLNGLLFK